MGSIAAIRLSNAQAGTRLRSALDANPGRRNSEILELDGGSDWLLGACGPDVWVAREGEWSAVGTGVLDNLAADADAGLELIHAAQTGPRSLAQLRGVFSAIVTDAHRLFAWRDHLGFSPLFSAGTPIAAIATTAGQALVGAGQAIEPDEEMVRQVFWGEPISEGAAYLRGAARIPKASLLTYEHGGHRIERYWQPRPYLETKRGRGDYRDEFVMRMTTAVERALGSDPVISLSGGIDAPTVAAFAASIHLATSGLPLPALSAVYPDMPSVDESGYIRLIAERHGLDLHTFVPSAGPFEDIRQLLAVTEAPVPTVSLAESAEYYRLAHDKGFRTILTGEMAEFVMAMGSQTLRHLVRHGRIGPAGRYLRAERVRGVSIRRVVRAAVESALPDGWARARRQRRGQLPQQQVEWLQTEMSAGRTPGARLGRENDAWEAQQVSAFVGPGLSVEADEAIQMSCGVRVRRPWLDIDLWEFFLSLPAEVKYPNGQYKALVRQWLRGIVPDEILDRRDRTYFDESFFARLDYSVISDLIRPDGYEMPGVDYSRLRRRLDEGGLSLIEAMWAKDLAVIHTFMDGWR
jgi:asparagine synthase (glutamine-hydrolysing)